MSYIGAKRQSWLEYVPLTGLGGVVLSGVVVVGVGGLNIGLLKSLRHARSAVVPVPSAV